MKSRTILSLLAFAALSACASPPKDGGETVLERMDSNVFPAGSLTGDRVPIEAYAPSINLTRYGNDTYWLTTTLKSPRRCRMRIDSTLGERIAAAWHRASPLFAELNERMAGMDYEVRFYGRGKRAKIDNPVSASLDQVGGDLSRLTSAMDAYCRDLLGSNRDMMETSLRELERD